MWPLYTLVVMSRMDEVCGQYSARSRMMSMISFGKSRDRERYWRRAMTEAIEGHFRRSKLGGWSEWV